MSKHIIHTLMPTDIEVITNEDDNKIVNLTILSVSNEIRESIFTTIREEIFPEMQKEMMEEKSSVDNTSTRVN